jgi:hypothetical protein
MIWIDDILRLPSPGTGSLETLMPSTALLFSNGRPALLRHHCVIAVYHAFSSPRARASVFSPFNTEPALTFSGFTHGYLQFASPLSLASA